MDIMEPGYKMLGSTGTQYLNPDYIQPLPTTLDSKNSPLALLAQTCSSIGKDCGSTPKLSLPSLTDKNKDQRDGSGLLGGGGAKDSSSSSSSSSRHRSTSDSPLIGSSSGGGVCGSNRSGEGTRSNRTAGGGGKSSVKDCSSSRSSSSDAAGGRAMMMPTGDENSPKPRGMHSSSRPLSSLVSTGSASGRCTPSSTIITSGSAHRDFASLRAGAGASASSASGLSLLPSSSAINNGKLAIGGEGGGGLLFDSYPEEFLKTSAGLLQHQSQSLQEALRLQHEGLQSLQAGLGPLPSAYPPLLFGHPLTAAAAALDPLMYSYSASLAAVHGFALNSHKLPTLSPYMGYARVSTAGGGSTLVPVCKDPYCTTGSLPPPPPRPPSLHSTQHGLQSPAAGTGAGTSCGNGCSQCGGSSGHDKTHRCTTGGLRPATTLAANGALGAPGGDVGQFSSPLYPLSLPSGGGGLVNPGLLGMAAAAQLGVGLTPYACSWLSGGEFCGKRFSKADDLLQHLRTHASSGDPAALPGFPSLPPGIPPPLPTSAFGAGHPFSIPGSSSLSPGSLLQQAVIAAAAAGQAYPRSLSPTTTALLNASRYHPYKSPFAAAVLPGTGTGASGGGGGLAPGALSASALDAYYSSPYALFGHRIGAAAVGP